MELLRKYGIITGLFAVIVIMVAIRNTGSGHFRYDAVKHSLSSVTGENLLTPETARALNEEILVVNLDSTYSGLAIDGMQTIHVSPSNILSADTRSRLRKHNGPVLIFSEQLKVSAAVWMILSQTGYKNICILTDGVNESPVKAEFRNDTLIAPEF